MKREPSVKILNQRGNRRSSVKNSSPLSKKAPSIGQFGGANSSVAGSSVMGAPKLPKGMSIQSKKKSSSVSK